MNPLPLLDLATRRAHPSLVPFGNFRTADSWIVLAYAKDKFWHRLVEAMGSPDWCADPRFITPAARAPLLGEHTESVLTELLSTEPETLRQLADEGAFGSQPQTP